VSQNGVSRSVTIIWSCDSVALRIRFAAVRVHAIDSRTRRRQIILEVEELVAIRIRRVPRRRAVWKSFTALSKRAPIENSADDAWGVSNQISRFSRARRVRETRRWVHAALVGGTSSWCTNSELRI
jgi:hypothetical protein